MIAFIKENLNIIIVVCLAALELCGIVYALFFEKINALCVKYREIVLYLVFGVLTTLVNFVVYYPLINLVHVSESFAPVYLQIVNTVAWAASVAFAFVTNKKYVFDSKAKDKKTLWREIPSFVGARVFSLLVEAAILGIFVSWLGFSENIFKLVAAVFVVIMNYFFSKFLIFIKK